MFIRIIKNDLEGKGNTRSHLYQCKSVLMQNAHDDTDTVFIAMDIDDVTLELTKKDHEVYYMNDDGKTIDRYHW